MRCRVEPWLYLFRYPGYLVCCLQGLLLPTADIHTVFVCYLLLSESGVAGSMGHRQAVAEEMKRQAGDAASRMRSGGTGVRVLRGEIDK